jgi:hypothetical protein
MKACQTCDSVPVNGGDNSVTRGITQAKMQRRLAQIDEGTGDGALDP